MAEYLWMLTRKIICGQLINIAVSIRTIIMLFNYYRGLSSLNCVIVYYKNCHAPRSMGPNNQRLFNIGRF